MPFVCAGWKPVGASLSGEYGERDEKVGSEVKEHADCHQQLEACVCGDVEHLWRCKGGEGGEDMGAWGCEGMG